MFVALGIWCGLFAVGILEGVVMTFAYPTEGGIPRVITLVASFLPFLFLVWLAFHLVRYRSRYSNLLFPDSGSDTSVLGPTDLHIVGLSLIGVFLIATAIPDFIRWLAVIIVQSIEAASERSIITGEATTSFPVAPYTIGEVVGSIGQLAIGVSLVALRFKITAIFLRAEKPAPPEPDLALCPTCGTSYDPSDYSDEAEVIYCSKCKTELPRDNA
jgi:hypothetical protein